MSCAYLAATPASRCILSTISIPTSGAGKALLNRPTWARIGGGWSTRFHGGPVEKSCSFAGYVDNFAVFFKTFSDQEIAARMKD